MNMICVDDEELVLTHTISLCEKLPQFSNGEIKGFTSGMEALSYLRGHVIDLAILDINMPDLNGITLAAMIKELRPDTVIIFLTGYSEYAIDAFALHAAGYLLKPVSFEKLSSEVEYALRGHFPAENNTGIRVQTFGNFDIMVDGKTVLFSRSKAKELLAYLIDRRGSGITRPEAFAVLWEDQEYTRPMQKQLDVIIRSLRDTLQEYGISDIFENQRGILKIRPEMIDCDYYRFFDGDVSAINAYRGEYMSNYPWAVMMEEYINKRMRAM